jgi:tetratricopeptide (TPR) repeat protein
VSAPDCATLADWLRSRERFPEAAAAYEEFFRRGLDRVSVSNTVEWTVRYYQRAGRLRDAKRLAEMAAEVGSARGIRALAGVYDREGQHQQAAALYRQILGRYDEGEDLLAYFIRRADATGRAPDDPEHAVLLERYFGGELDRVATPSLSGAPTHGLFVNSTTWWNEKAGFRRGDIVVAMDGVRVWTMAQSDVLYERSFDAPLRYTVWRDDHYLDIEAPFRRFYYGVDMSEYPARRPLAENHS